MEKKKNLVPTLEKESAKKVLTAELLILTILIFGIIGTIAGFLMDKSHVSNKFTIGYNKSNIEEEFGNYSSFEAGKTYTKKVSVKNTGNVPCYVRVFAEIENNKDDYSVDYDTQHWKKSGDYYYYRTPLEPGKTTEPLFTSITNLSNHNHKDFSMTCYEETVQAESFDKCRTGFCSWRKEIGRGKR